MSKKQRVILYLVFLLVLALVGEKCVTTLHRPSISANDLARALEMSWYKIKVPAGVEKVHLYWVDSKGELTRTGGGAILSNSQAFDINSGTEVTLFLMDMAKEGYRSITLHGSGRTGGGGKNRIYTNSKIGLKGGSSWGFIPSGQYIQSGELLADAGERHTESFVALTVLFEGDYPDKQKDLDRLLIQVNRNYRSKAKDKELL